ITVGYRNTSIRPDPGDAPASVDKIDEVGEERGLFFLPGAPMQPVIPGHAEIGSLPEDAIGPGDPRSHVVNWAVIRDEVEMKVAIRVAVFLEDGLGELVLENAATPDADEDPIFCGGDRIHPGLVHHRIVVVVNAPGSRLEV